MASVGHLYGFGNTLDKALTAVVGCKERGRQVDGPLDHSTGKGWVKDHAYGKGWGQDGYGLEKRKWMGAQYYDAKWVKKAITRLVLVETLGGIAPPTKQFLHRWWSVNMLSVQRSAAPTRAKCRLNAMRSNLLSVPSVVRGSFVVKFFPVLVPVRASPVPSVVRGSTWSFV